MSKEITIKNELLYFPEGNIKRDSNKKKLPIELYVIFEIDYFSIRIYTDDNNIILYRRNIINDYEELDIYINRTLKFDVKDFSGDGLDYINFIKCIKENKNCKLNLLFSGSNISIFHEYKKNRLKSSFSIFWEKKSAQKSISKYDYFELHDSEKGFLDYFIFKDNKILLNHNLE